MGKIVYIESNSNDPTYNLALEQYVFDEMSKDVSYFWLWQNANTIVVGKHQNTMEEINFSYVKEHDIAVVRRLSGGGAVYHDMGNVNFTFITDVGGLEKLNLQVFCMPVIRTLEKIGIHAEVSGRNDITIDGRKFSGNSQYIKGKRVMHHGTLMFDSDLSVVSQALAVSADKYESKGFQSVRSRVTNIRPHAPEPIEMESFKALLKRDMAEGQEVEHYYLTEEEQEHVLEIKQDRYDKWEWNFGASPDYTVSKVARIENVGKLDLHLLVTGGIIEGYESYGDYFGNGATEELKERLIGCPLREEDIRLRLKGFNLDLCYSKLSVNDFVTLLIR